jgi:RNA polymerase sigma-70 factor (ECF subfamily)
MADHYDLFENCRKGDANAQRILYDLFKGKLMGMCRRYTRSKDEAQDILQESFIKIFSKISQIEYPEKFESWMKAIVIRTAINHYHGTKTYNLRFAEIREETFDIQVRDVDTLTDEYLLTVVNRLPDGCRIIFNLHAIEGYSHGEIAQMLDITEGTSRSQLHHAKTLLKEKLKCHSLAHYYEKFA